MCNMNESYKHYAKIEKPDTKDYRMHASISTKFWKRQNDSDR